GGCGGDRDRPGERRGRPKSRDRGGHAGGRVRPRDRRPREPTPRGGTEARGPGWHRRSPSVRDRVSPPKTAEKYSSATRMHATERSEEHTSELQSRVDLVCRLLLEKKKKNSSN